MAESQDIESDTNNYEQSSQESGCTWQVQDVHTGVWHFCRIRGAHRPPEEDWLDRGLIFAPQPPLVLCDRHLSKLCDWAHQYGSGVGMFVGRRRLVDVEIAAVKKETAALQRELGRLKNRREEIRKEVLDRGSRPIEEVGSTVYVLRRERDGLIKIGYTTNLLGRLGTHWQQQGPVVVLALLDGDRQTEFWLHARFRPHLAEGREWFHPHPDLLAWIDTVRRNDEEAS